MKLRHLPLSVYGWTYWLPMLVAGAIVAITFLPINDFISIIVAVMTLLTLAFFRDFPRAVPGDSGIMVAPADGTVTDVAAIDHYPPFDGPALRIGMFLSVLDVHVNRSPCDGVVLWTRFEDGQFLDARHPQCGVRNQSNTIALAESPDEAARVVVKQIVGAIARRIICPLVPGERVARGERIGMIAFGSRTELYVRHPEKWEPTVRVGEHLRAGCDRVLKLKGG